MYRRINILEKPLLTRGGSFSSVIRRRSNLVKSSIKTLPKPKSKEIKKGAIALPAVGKQSDKKMGFFKNLFKKKKGGTFVGNLIRGVASKATGGILGNGAQLRQWEAEQEQQKINELQSKVNQLSMQQRQGAQKMGGDLVTSAVNHGVAQPQTDPNAGEAVLLEALKKYWYFVLAGVLLLVFGVWFIARKK